MQRAAGPTLTDTMTTDMEDALIDEFIRLGWHEL